MRETAKSEIKKSTRRASAAAAILALASFGAGAAAIETDNGIVAVSLFTAGGIVVPATIASAKRHASERGNSVVNRLAQDQAANDIESSTETAPTTQGEHAGRTDFSRGEALTGWGATIGGGLVALSTSGAEASMNGVPVAPMAATSLAIAAFGFSLTVVGNRRTEQALTEQIDTIHGGNNPGAIAA